MTVLSNLQMRPLAAAGDASSWDLPRRAHLVGIAGSGMRSLAGLLLDAGWTLTGSDVSPRGIETLAARGVAVSAGHAESHLPDNAALVIRSDAIPDDNPEVVSAYFRGVPVYSYFETLAWITGRKRVVAVAGTHGKSTTAAMTAAILVEAGLDPTAVFGATPMGATFGSRLGHSSWAVVEACEYRANFLHFQPEKAVILGVEADHFDHYESLPQLQAAFEQFALRVRSHGSLLVRYECSRAREAAAAALAEVETFGWDERATWSARELRSTAGRYRFALYRRQRRLGEIQLQTPGRHNVLNALAAAALAARCGAATPSIERALTEYPGLARRMEQIGNPGGVELWDDYAHHPTEVTAALQTVRETYPERRVYCVFQPHQASRTAHLLDELAASLENSDRTYIAEIFRARENPPSDGDVSAADLAAKLRKRGGSVGQQHELPAIAEALRRELRPSDVLITLGAGDIRAWTEALAGALSRA